MNFFYQSNFLDKLFDFIELFFNADSPFLLLVPLLKSIFWFATRFVLPLGILAVGLHALFSLPMRRRERARLFLDLLESSLAQGRSVEHTIVSAAETRDRALGVRFYLLAAHIESGLRFSAALEKVPRFLPPQISRILRVGEKLGDLSRVLPACRESLREPSIFVKSAIHYMFILLLAFCFVAIIFTSAVFPRIPEIIAGTFSTTPKFRFPIQPLILFEVSIAAFLSLGVLIYVGGPRLMGWFRFRGFPVVDWIAWRISWKRMRLQKVFSSTLAVLLDGGVPEKEAVQLAGNCTANTICEYRSRRIISELENGIRLDDAVRVFDDSGEFHWRLRNAIHAKNGFLDALCGWHETLAAKAFQREEAAAHLFTSAIILLNGAFVAVLASALFWMLTTILEEAAL